MTRTLLRGRHCLARIWRSYGAAGTTKNLSVPPQPIQQRKNPESASFSGSVGIGAAPANIFVHAQETWPHAILSSILESLAIHENFVDATEEGAFLNETAAPLKRLRYEEDHWDDAIKLYREIERADWGPVCQKVIDRVRQVSLPKNDRHLKFVHVLDLAKDGCIKPHVDSVKYCGDVIAGLSLLTDCVMRLVHSHHKTLTLDLHLKRRSLYILSGPGRYDFTHEILPSEESFFNGNFVDKNRRISVVCRSLPKDGPSFEKYLTD